MDIVESNFGITKQSLYDGICPDKNYHLAFDDDPDVYDVVIPYGQAIKDQNTE